MATTDIEKALGMYLYGFVRASDFDESLIAGILGVNDTSVRWMESSGIGIVYSVMENTKLRPQRKLLTAHQAVVATLAKNVTSLPMAFGIIADSESQLCALLQKNAETILTQLQRVDGKIEFTFALKWTAENIFQYFVERSPELQSARDTIATGKASREEQIEFGRMFEKLIGSEREAITDRVRSALELNVTEFLLQSIREESDVFRAALLVDRNAEESLNNAIEAVASSFDSNFAFSYSGPWPPYSFVSLNLAFNE